MRKMNFVTMGILAGAAALFSFTSSKTSVSKESPLEVTLDKFHTGTIAQKDIPTVGHVLVVNKSGTDGNFPVQSYTIAISPTHGMAYMENAIGNSITKNTKERLKNLTKGDLIVVAHVKIAGSADEVPGMTLKVE